MRVVATIFYLFIFFFCCCCFEVNNLYLQSLDRIYWTISLQLMVFNHSHETIWTKDTTDVALDKRKPPPWQLDFLFHSLSWECLKTINVNRVKLHICCQWSLVLYLWSWIIKLSCLPNRQTTRSKNQHLLWPFPTRWTIQWRHKLKLLHNLLFNWKACLILFVFFDSFEKNIKEAFQIFRATSMFWVKLNTEKWSFIVDDTFICAIISICKQWGPVFGQGFHIYCKTMVLCGDEAAVCTMVNTWDIMSTVAISAHEKNLIINKLEYKHFKCATYIVVFSANLCLFYCLLFH